MNHNLNEFFWISLLVANITITIFFLIIAKQTLKVTYIAYTVTNSGAYGWITTARHEHLTINLSSPLLPTHAHTDVCDHAAPHTLNLKTFVDYLFACEKQKKTLRRMEVLKKRQQQVWLTAVMMPILKLGPYINIRLKHPMHQVCLIGVEIWKGGSSSH